MILYPWNVETVGSLEAEADDPSDRYLDDFAAPRLCGVALSWDGSAAAQRILDEAKADAVDLLDPDHEPEWHEEGWHHEKGFRPRKLYRLRTPDGEHLATLVVQELEATP